MGAITAVEFTVIVLSSKSGIKWGNYVRLDFYCVLVAVQFALDQEHARFCAFSFTLDKFVEIFEFGLGTTFS